MTYDIKILDKNGELIGEMINTSSEDIRIFMQKGFTIINFHTGTEITEEILMNNMGVSDGVIMN